MICGPALNFGKKVHFQKLLQEIAHSPAQEIQSLRKQEKAIWLFLTSHLCFLPFLSASVLQASLFREIHQAAVESINPCFSAHQAASSSGNRCKPSKHPRKIQVRLSLPFHFTVDSKTIKWSLARTGEESTPLSKDLKKIRSSAPGLILHWFRTSHPNITHKSHKRGQILKKDLCIPHWYYIFMEFFFWSPQVITSVDRTVFLGSPGLCWRRELMMLLWNVAPMGGGRGSVCFGGLLWESPGFPCEEDNLLSQKSQVSFEEGCLTAIYSIHAYQKK